MGSDKRQDKVMKYLKLFEGYLDHPYQEVDIDDDSLDRHMPAPPTRSEKTKIKKILGTGWKMDEEEHSVGGSELTKYITANKITGNKKIEIDIYKHDDMWYSVTIRFSSKTKSKRRPGGYMWKSDTDRYFKCDQEHGLYQCLKDLKLKLEI